MTTQKKLKLHKEGPMVYITNNELGKTIRFNLKNKSMEKQNDKDEWYSVKQQYKLFKDCNLDNIEYTNKDFEKLLHLCTDTYNSTKSLSTYISNLDRVLIYEPFIQYGFECRASYRTDWNGSCNPKTIEIPMNKYPKELLKFLKSMDQSISSYTEMSEENMEEYAKFIMALNNSTLDDEQKKELYGLYSCRYSTRDSWNMLVDEYNFEPKALAGYLCNYLKKFEGLEFDEGVRTLKDYYRMAKRIGRNVKKYPKYLKSMHDIIQSNYDAYKTEYDEQLFEELANKNDYSFEGTEYIMVNPMKSKDIIQEGTDNNHCVGSYVEDILKEKTWIVFLRKKDTKEFPEQSKKSLITVEIQNNEIIQARGSYNRSMNKEEKEFLELYSKKKKMELKL